MKKIILTLLPFSFLLSPLFLNAQQPQLPESSFEQPGWKMKVGADGVPYEDFITDYFGTLNPLRSVENEPRLATITAYKDPIGPQNGLYSIKLVSGNIPVPPDNYFLPGLVGTIDKDFVEEFFESINSGGDGEISTSKLWYGNDCPHALEGYYKYHPVGGDSALIEIGFYKGGKDPVFLQQLIIKETVNQWTKFSIKIPEQYWSELFFTHIRVLFVASAGFDLKKLLECKGQEGSTLWIDNIYLNYTDVGIKQDLFSTLTTKTYPNPATEALNIELNEHFAGKVMVYNLLGSLIMEENFSGTQGQLNISTLAAGNYVYKLMNDNTIFAQGKFVVTR